VAGRLWQSQNSHGLGGLELVKLTLLQTLSQGSSLLWQGLGWTLCLILIVSSLSLPLGLLLGVLRCERFKLPKAFYWFSSAYIECIRGLPLLLFLIFVHYGLMPCWMDRPPVFVSACLAMTLFESAYVAEIFRAGLLSLREEELDACQSLGLTFWQQLWFVWLPLAWQRALPALLNQGVTLIKDTSLASVIGVIEWTRAGEILSEQSSYVSEFILLQALVYFLLCYGLSRLAQKLVEKHLLSAAQLMRG
jgi:His/Glu/Gln/Arg/opine family amino acid ABC transporter permease subunit